MAEVASTGQAVATEPPSKTDAKPWLDMLAQAKRVFQPWQDKCDNISKIYADLDRLSGANKADREFQMFWANLEVLKPSIYSRAPQPVVVPRFKDRKPVPRRASEMLQRCLIASFDVEKVHETLKLVRNDLALFSRGVIWERYESYAGDTTDPAEEELDESGIAGEPEHVDAPQAELVAQQPQPPQTQPAQAPTPPTPQTQFQECVRYEWVHRKDFLHEPSRVWQEVGWVARRVFLTDKAGKRRFKKKWVNVQLKDSKDTDDAYKIDQKGAVWEIWHKAQNVVVWVSEGCEEVLDIQPPHLTLDGFFPCPKPAFGTVKPETLLPIPDMLFYKDQLEEINELTARISALSEALKAKGFYPGGAEDLASAIEALMKSTDNRALLVPVPGFAALGGQSLADSVVWLPIEKISATVVALVGLRKTLIEDVYQISGISDIMRGSTEASETLGAQQLKSQYGSIRIKERQAEMIGVADGCLNIAGEIMSENFQPATLLAMSQTDDLPPQAAVMEQIKTLMIKAQSPDVKAMVQANPQQGQAAAAQIAQQVQTLQNTVTVEAVMALLRGQRIRPFILQIATDSTIQPDENAEKQARNEFGQAFAQTTQALAPMLQVMPEAADFAGEMLKFMLAPFRAGRQMEGAIDDFVEMVKQKSQASAGQPKPDPEAAKMAAAQQAHQQEQAAAAEAHTRELQLRDQQHQQGMQQRAADQAAKDAQTARDNAAKDAQARRDAEAADRQQAAKEREMVIAASSARAREEHDRAIMAMQRQIKADEVAIAKINLILKNKDIEIADARVKQAAMPKPAPANGNGEAHA